MAKTKKQHYVPQCYLKNFTIDGSKDKINVYDLKKDDIRYKQCIKNIAEGNYFYDIDLRKIIKSCPSNLQQEFSKMTEEEISCAEQSLENFFGNEIENKIQPIVDKVINKAQKATPFEIANCYCMRKYEKEMIGIYMVYQYFRTNMSRNIIGNSMISLKEQQMNIAYNMFCIKQGIKHDDKFALKINPSEELCKYIHISCLLDLATNPEHVIDLAKEFCRHLWVLFVNKTHIPFWTSDSPIVLKKEKENNSSSRGIGIGSSGVQIFFPLSNNVVLGLFDRKVYEGLFCDELSGKDVKDRIYLPACHVGFINDINKMQLEQCERNVFACDVSIKNAQKWNNNCF